jgi:hypothetical protein
LKYPRRSRSQGVFIVWPANAALGFGRSCTTTPAVVSITTRSGANIIRQSGCPKERMSMPSSDHSFERLRIDIEPLHRQQAASGHKRCAHLVKFSPAIKAAATTPAQRLNVSLRSFHPDVSVFADRVVGSACPLSFRGLLSVHSRCGLHTRAVTNS